MAQQRPLRVLFVTPYYAPAWGYGGPPRVVHDLARALVARGNSVTVLTTDALDEGRGAGGLELAEGVEIVRTRNVSNTLAWRTKQFLAPALPARALAAARRHDLVHATEARSAPAAAAFAAARAAGRPFCLSPHGTLPSSEGLRGAAKRVYDTVLTEPMLRAAALVAAQTEHEAQLARSLGARDDAVEQLPLPIDLASFANVPSRTDARARFGFDSEDIVVVAVARVHPLKGLDLLTESVRRAREQEPRLRLLVVGRHDGAVVPPQDRVEHVGPLYGEERLHAYAACDVFALTPRFWEETSLAALEAAACGRPVVLTHQAAIPGLDESGGGELVDADAAAIAAALLRVLERRADAGAAARQLVEERHAAPRVGERLESLYRERLE